jgi:hypothetical protein
MSAFVQGTGIQSVGSVDSVGIAFGSNVTAGNALFAHAVVGNIDPAVGVVTDTLTDTYTRSVVHGPAFGHNAIYDARGIAAGGANTVTLNPAGSDFMSLDISEASGIHATAPVDATATGNAASGTSVITGNLVTTLDAFIVGGMSHNIGGTVTITPTYTQIFEDEDTADIPFAGQYRIPGAAGTYTMAWTIGTSGEWICCAVAYKDAAWIASGGGAADDRFRFRPSNFMSGTSTLGQKRSAWPDDARDFGLRDSIADNRTRN